MDIKQATTTATGQRVKAAVVAFVFLLSTGSYAMPPEFNASYSAQTYGMTVAEASYTLKHHPDGISFSQHTRPVGLAALFSNDELNENSELSLHNGRLLLDEYNYVQKGDDKNRNVHLKIEWNGTAQDQPVGTIRGTAGGENVHIQTTTPAWDTLSFQIPVMMHTRADNPPVEQSVLVKGVLKTYTFITHGNEKIEVGGNELDTIKIERRGDNADEPIYFWVAPGLNNLPVKIEKWKKNRPRVTMLLKQASFPSNNKLRFSTSEDLENDFE